MRGGREHGASSALEPEIPAHEAENGSVVTASEGRKAERTECGLKLLYRTCSAGDDVFLARFGGVYRFQS